MLTHLLTKNRNLTALEIQPGDTVLGAITHPDDFSVFHWGISNEIHRNGGIVKVAYVSDGKNSTKGNRNFVRFGGRRLEAIAESMVMGVAFESMVFLDGPDSDCTEPVERQKLYSRFLGLLNKLNPAAIFTPGEDGVDGHLGHIATHDAMLQARNQYAEDSGYNPPIWGININGDGELAVPVDRTQKLLAIAQNHSQFPNTITENGIHFSGFALEQLSFYAMNGLMQVETYDRY